MVRNGWRAPHVWVDEKESESVLDWFGDAFVLLLGPDCDSASWGEAVEALPTGAPVEIRQLPAGRAIAPYRRVGVVLVRPDGAIAQHLNDETGPADLSEITPYVPSIATG